MVEKGTNSFKIFLPVDKRKLIFLALAAHPDYILVSQCCTKETFFLCSQFFLKCHPKDFFVRDRGFFPLYQLSFSLWKHDSTAELQKTS